MWRELRNILLLVLLALAIWGAAIVLARVLDWLVPAPHEWWLGPEAW